MKLKPKPVPIVCLVLAISTLALWLQVRQLRAEVDLLRGQAAQRGPVEHGQELKYKWTRKGMCGPRRSTSVEVEPAAGLDSVSYGWSTKGMSANPRFTLLQEPERD